MVKVLHRDKRVDPVHEQLFHGRLVEVNGQDVIINDGSRFFIDPLRVTGGKDPFHRRYGVEDNYGKPEEKGMTEPRVLL